MPVVLPYRIRQRKKLVFALLLGAAAVIWAAVIISNPLRQSPGEIESRLKRQTPLGTSMEQVRAFLQEKKWYDPNQIETRGFARHDVRGESVGAYSLHGYLGYYGCVFSTYVEAFWGFDKDQKLIAIYV